MTGQDLLAAAVTWLFVPASRPDRFPKALASGAEAVVVDLEDAVAAPDKARARENLREHRPEAAGTPVVVRVNARNGPEHAADMAACRAQPPAAVVLPKTESVDDVAAVREAGGLPVLPLIETARGLVNLPGIAAAPGVARLLFGSVDLALDLSVTDDAALDSARSDLVRWSAACGLPQPVDGVSTAVRDAEAVARAARRSSAWGFGGKLCVHPAQLAPVRAAFAPGDEELRWAARVLAAAPAGSAAVVDGEMIDRPVVERARRLLQRADRA